jgi:hypothetical protein
MKNKRYHTVATVSIEKSLIQDRSLSWLGKGTSINSGGVKLTFLGTQTFPFREIMEL